MEELSGWLRESGLRHSGNYDSALRDDIDRFGH